MQVLAILNQKGGVGKTTTTVNLAAALAQAGQRVLVVDLDSQANTTEMLCCERISVSIFDVLVDTERVPLADVLLATPIEGVQLAPGHRALAGLESALREVIGRELLLKEVLAEVAAGFDFAIIDNSPTLGIGLALSLVAADVALIPVACEPLAVAGLAQIARAVVTARARLNPSLKRRVLLTRLNTRTTHGKEVARAVREQFEGEVFATEIRESAELQRGFINRALGSAVTSYAPGSPPATWFHELAREVLAGGENGTPAQNLS